MDPSESSLEGTPTLTVSLSVRKVGSSDERSRSSFSSSLLTLFFAVFFFQVETSDSSSPLLSLVSSSLGLDTSRNATSVDRERWSSLLSFLHFISLSPSISSRLNDSPLLGYRIRSYDLLNFETTRFGSRGGRESAKDGCGRAALSFNRASSK